jgi:hypothetical protein
MKVSAAIMKDTIILGIAHSGAIFGGALFSMI